MKRRTIFPLFWRIFLSIWLAMAVTVVVSNLATRVLLDREREAIERQVGLRDLAEEAIEIRESGDRSEAWRFLRSEGERLELYLVLIEQDENDGKLPSFIRDRMNSGWYPQKPAVLDVGDGYRLVAWPRINGAGWLDPKFFRAIELGLALIMISLACWWIARLVSRPLRHMETTAQAIASGDNSLRVSNKIARRRDEVGQLATAFNAMTEQLCSLLERQKHLLRDISHDLRTPLARQRVAIELAIEDGADEELMASILRQNERLETMTGQILALYRVTEAGGDIEREPLKPVKVINRVLQDAADYAEHQGVDCKLVASPESAGTSVLGDEGLLQRAIDNILQNALDHTPPGKVVNLAVSVSDGWLDLTIEDEGPGVPEELVPHLFEPFFRADKSRGGTGWGLGLAIARDIVSAHDGEITAAVGEPGGLRVTVRLPVFIQG
ncbi:two-component sensor histidine kinase [Marinobacter guineae]|uniref:Signal transduction histidine-protein kinase/phosphatase MprB n=1 Tax=Marinobacter guineae TaxID=432303 RepID=A0A2G1VJM2_9GAMM|nr:HAMP domain-containing sensor histidine kinase [Marinobacter guineae]PHQ26965.1 two-component sensor histidine kinase [Marinobacter guineae]